MELAKYNVRLTRPKAIHMTMIKTEPRSRAHDACPRLAESNDERNPKCELRIPNSDCLVFSAFSSGISEFTLIAPLPPFASNSSESVPPVGTQIHTVRLSPFRHSGLLLV